VEAAVDEAVAVIEGLIAKSLGGETVGIAMQASN
jgi:hypothetical protein